MILERLFGRAAVRRAELAIERPLAAGEAAVAKVNGRNVRAGLGGWHVDMPWVSAEIRAGEVGRPVDLAGLVEGRLGRDTIAVSSARIDAEARQLNRAAAELLPALGVTPLERVVIDFGADQRVSIAARLRAFGRAVPVRARATLRVADPATVAVKPERLTVFGVPLGWALRLFGRDELPVRVDRLPGVVAPLTELRLERGRAHVTLGGPPAEAIPAARREGAANWVELVARGEVDAGQAAIADARVVMIDRTPGDPLRPQRWEQEARLRLGYGRVAVPEATIRARAEAAAREAGFTPSRIAVTADGIAVEGTAALLGLPVPVACNLACEASRRGELRLVPRDVKVAGLGFGRGQLLDALARQPGLRRDGDGVIVDVAMLAGADLPALSRVRAVPGALLLESGR